MCNEKVNQQLLATMDEREAFEFSYAQKWQSASHSAAQYSIDHLCNELKEMRNGDKYGDGQDYLNFLWEGWQSRAAIAAAEAAQPVVLQQTVSLTDERAAFEAWLQEGIDETDTVRPSDDKVEAYFATWLARSKQQSSVQPVLLNDEIYRLLASAWFYGDWIAETAGERRMQSIMEGAGWWPIASEDELISKLSCTSKPLPVPDGWQAAMAFARAALAEAIQIAPLDRLPTMAGAAMQQIDALLAASQEPVGVAEPTDAMIDAIQQVRLIDWCCDKDGNPTTVSECSARAIAEAMLSAASNP